MDFRKELKERTEYIETVLREFLPEEEGKNLTVIKAMNYGMTGGGKRLRPLFMMEVHKLFKGNSKSLKSFMTALEMIHNYSLIHDDLPAMDNDEFRRGRKTTHAVFGETMGILAGDALLNYAFEVASKALVSDLSMATAKAMEILAKKAGIYGMIGGQVVDIESEGKKADIETLNYIHNNKTAALIEAAMMIGAVLADASEEDVKTIEKIANNVGLAFQIQDDILDEIGDEEKIGKPVGSDAKNEKSTYVSIVGLDKSKKIVKDLSEEAIELLKGFEGDSEFLEELITSLIYREK